MNKLTQVVHGIHLAHKILIEIEPFDSDDLQEASTNTALLIQNYMSSRLVDSSIFNGDIPSLSFAYVSLTHSLASSRVALDETLIYQKAESRLFFFYQKR